MIMMLMNSDFFQVDPMEGEQTWPTEEELAEAEKRMAPKKRIKRVPKGTSEYQAAWIVESDDGAGIFIRVAFMNFSTECFQPYCGIAIAVASYEFIKSRPVLFNLLLQGLTSIFTLSSLSLVNS